MVCSQRNQRSDVIIQGRSMKTLKKAVGCEERMQVGASEEVNLIGNGLSVDVK